MILIHSNHPDRWAIAALFVGGVVQWVNHVVPW